MKTPDWDRIQEIYDEARNLPRSELCAFVEKASKGDPVIARDVMDLIALDDEPFMEPPINLPLTPTTDDLVGRIISERYFIEQELGQGGMSKVYLARDRTLDSRAVVIKFLSRELLEHPYARQKFKQESEALSRIHHPNVVQVLDKNELPDGRPYFVMEFVDGKSLRPQITSGGMNLKRAATILKQLGAALDEVHQHGIFHRDLKPENILLRRGTDDVVLIDFGIARVTDSLVAPTTTAAQSAGTLMYMSPEQLRSETVTAASDIYSMGVIAYEMVTGRRPFNTDSIARLSVLQKKRLRLKPRRLREELSPQAEALILRALSFAPSSRYERASEFGDVLSAALLDSSVIRRARWPGLVRAFLLILIGGALISFGIYKIIDGPSRPEPNRSFNYFLSVQRMRDEQPYNDPYRSHGEEKYDKGDKFRLTVSTPVPAFLYIFHEGQPQRNDTSFRLIYPNQATNKGSASVGANQSVESDWITFRGAENFWIVWSTSPVSELDSITSDAFKDPGGGLTGQTLVAIRLYLTAKKAEIDATTFNYNANRTAVVRGKQDMLVTLAEFKLR